MQAMPKPSSSICHHRGSTCHPISNISSLAFRASSLNAYRSSHMSSRSLRRPAIESALLGSGARQSVSSCRRLSLSASLLHGTSTSLPQHERIGFIRGRNGDPGLLQPRSLLHERRASHHSATSSNSSSAVDRQSKPSQLQRPASMPGHMRSRIAEHASSSGLNTHSVACHPQTSACALDDMDSWFEDDSDRSSSSSNTSIGSQSNVSQPAGSEYMPAHMESQSADQHDSSSSGSESNVWPHKSGSMPSHVEFQSAAHDGSSTSSSHGYVAQPHRSQAIPGHTGSQLDPDSSSSSGSSDDTKRHAPGVPGQQSGAGHRQPGLSTGNSGDPNGDSSPKESISSQSLRQQQMHSNQDQDSGTRESRSSHSSRQQQVRGNQDPDSGPRESISSQRPRKQHMRMRPPPSARAQPRPLALQDECFAQMLPRLEVSSVLLLPS